MVARQHDNVIICHVNKKLNGFKIYLCAKFGCSTDCQSNLVVKEYKQCVQIEFSLNSDCIDRRKFPL